MSTAGPLLEIENLKVIFHDDRGRTTHAVDCVDLTVRRGQTLGLVGESGCGKSVTALAIMGLLPKGPAEVRVDDYPHRLSGGMRQRVMIALALACDPKLLIADEPTTALDVTIQAQILDLMRDLKAATGAAIILITHDLGVVAEVCDEVAVMYAGEIVERAPVEVLFAAPQHPYTVGLLGSIPRLDWSVDELAAVDGMVPDLAALPAGCRFAPRCPFVREICTQVAPPLAPIGPGHHSRCLRAPLEQVLA